MNGVELTIDECMIADGMTEISLFLIREVILLLIEAISIHSQYVVY